MADKGSAVVLLMFGLGRMFSHARAEAGQAEHCSSHCYFLGNGPRVGAYGLLLLRGHGSWTPRRHECALDQKTVWLTEFASVFAGPFLVSARKGVG